MRSWTGNLPWSAGIYDLCSALVLLQNRQVSISQVSTCKWYVRAPLWAPGQVSRTESCSKSHQAITALRIISLQWRIPCTSQNIKWSLKVYLKCLSHVPEFPRSSSDFWLCKKNSHQERMNPIRRYLGPPCQSRSSGTKCSPGAWVPVLSSLSAKLLSPESPAIFITGGMRVWWDVWAFLRYGRLTILVGECVWERKEMQVLGISSDGHLRLKWDLVSQKAGW